LHSSAFASRDGKDQIKNHQPIMFLAGNFSPRTFTCECPSGGGKHRISVGGRNLLTEYQGKGSAQILAAECAFLEYPL
jgi:hypothetical protein